MAHNHDLPRAEVVSETHETHGTHCNANTTLCFNMTKRDPYKKRRNDAIPPFFVEL